MSLAHTTLGAGPRRAVVAHGILGSGRNWRSLIRKLAARSPEWTFSLVDLRNHGDSHGLAGPHDLAACARDVMDLQPELVIGHSFGGKVALACLRDHGLPELIVLDALPGPLTGTSQVDEVIAALRKVPVPLQQRNELGDHLPLSRSLVAWMSTNLRAGPDGLRWRFDLTAVEEMMADYARSDFWPLVERTDAPITFVRAGRSDRWNPEVLARFTELPPWSPVRLQTLPNAGHWLHVDDPDGLLDVLVACLGPGQ